MRRRHWIAVLSCALSGCALHPTQVQPIDPGGCPETLRQRISLSASVAQIRVPEGLTLPSGPVRLHAGTGLRVLLAVRIAGPLPSVRLLGNSISILTYGGVLAGWARIISPPRAADSESIAVQGGWLQIAPFISGPRVHAQTQTVDLLVIPGGHPIAGLAVQPGPMWQRDGAPMPPRRMRFRLIPDFHMTQLHAVDATATFRFAAHHLTGAHEHCECSIPTNFTLVNRESGLPSLWVLRATGPHTPAGQVLALYSRRIGVFKAAFLNPDTARGFALWESQTHSTRAGGFALGLLGSSPHARFKPFSTATNIALAVAQWGTR